MMYHNNLFVPNVDQNFEFVLNHIIILLGTFVKASSSSQNIVRFSDKCLGFSRNNLVYISTKQSFQHYLRRLQEEEDSVRVSKKHALDLFKKKFNNDFIISPNSFFTPKFNSSSSKGTKVHRICKKIIDLKVQIFQAGRFW